MNLILMCVCCILVNTFADTIKFTEKDFASVDDRADFLTIFEDTIAVRLGVVIKDSEISKYSVAGVPRVFALPSEIAYQQVGLKEGDKLKLLKYKDSKFSEFVIGKYLYLLLFDGPEGFEKSNFGIILSNDKTDHLNLSKNLLKRKSVSGFAYKGVDREMENGFKRQIIFSQLPKSDSFWKANFLDEKISAILLGNVFHYPMYVVSSNSNDSPYKNLPYIKVDDKTFEGGTYNLDLFDNGSKHYLEGYNVFKDTIAMRLFREVGELDRMKEYLLLISPTKVELVYLAGYIDEEAIP